MPHFFRSELLNKKKACKPSGLQAFPNGAYGIRTRDLHTASVARSQLRQCPIASILTHSPKKASEKCCN